MHVTHSGEEHDARTQGEACPPRTWLPLSTARPETTRKSRLGVQESTVRALREWLLLAQARMQERSGNAGHATHVLEREAGGEPSAGQEEPCGSAPARMASLRGVGVPDSQGKVVHACTASLLGRRVIQMKLQ